MSEQQDHGDLFLEALEAHRKADIDRAIDLLRKVIRSDPRLPEPHLQLGRIHLDAGRLEDAEHETREALKWLEGGGQWVDDLPEEVMQSVAHGQMGEVLRQIAESDEVIFGDPGRFQKLLKEARSHFDKARQLDPTNEHAEMFSIHLKGESKGEA